MLRSFGLIETRGELTVVTPLGGEYLEDPTNERLLDIARNRVVGVNELLDWLGTEPRSVDELLALFREHLGVEWESTAQIQFRLGWLSVLGAAASSQGRWYTT